MSEKFSVSDVAIQVSDDSVSFEEWHEKIRGIAKVSQAHQFWIGDLLNIGEEKWHDQTTQVLPDLGLEEGTISNYRWVAKKVDPDRRRDDLTWQHHLHVAKLEPEDQVKWLERAAKKKMSAATLKSAIKMKLDKDDERESSKADADGGDEADGRYRVILASVGREETMDALEQVRVPAEQDSVLFLVVPAERLRDGVLLLECWNFAFASSAVLDVAKDEGKHWFRTHHRVVLVGTRGNIKSPPAERLAPSILKGKIGKGGGLPDAVYDNLADMFPTSRKKDFRLDLFAKDERDGWVAGCAEETEPSDAE